MALLDKVTENVKICGVEISLIGDAIPSTLEDWQLFYNSTFANNSFQKTHSGKSTLEFSEESIESPAGVAYKQKVSFKFPSTDIKRAERIALLMQLKFIKLKLTNGLEILIGRNDYNQNTKPNVKLKGNEQLSEIEVESLSIFPSGFTPTSINDGENPQIPVIVMIPVRIIFDYTIAEVTIPSGMKIIDIENLNNSNKAVSWSIISNTEVLILDNCLEGDTIKITGFNLT